MRKIILLLTLVVSLSCKAQSPVLPFYGKSSTDINGAYYKDINNFNDQFVGTWVLNSGDISLKVVFQKKNMFREPMFDKTIFADYLVGEYEYKVNGITKVNTLSNLNYNHNEIYDYNLINQYIIYRGSNPPCIECVGAEPRLLFAFQELETRDPTWASDASFIVRKYIENGVEKLKVQFVLEDSGGPVPSNLQPTSDYLKFTIPFGEYTLTKQ